MDCGETVRSSVSPRSSWIMISQSTKGTVVQRFLFPGPGKTILNIIIMSYFWLFFAKAESTAAATDNAAEMNRRKARLSMKIGAKIWVKVLALTPGGASPKKIENSAAEAGTLLRVVPKK